MASLLAIPKETFMKHRKTLWKSYVLMLCLSAGYMLRHGQVNFQPRKADASVVPAGKSVVSYAKLPLSFEANQGQIDPRVKFLSRGPGYTLFLTGDQVALELHGPGVRSQESGPGHIRSALRRTTDHAHRTRESLLRLKLVNANQNAVATGASELPGKANYFVGKDPHKWRTNVPTYAKVKYARVYPGVDLVFYGNQRQLEHDFVVSPGADASRIAFRLEGSKKVSLDAEGALAIAVEAGKVRFEKPVIYQEDNSGRREIPGGYVIKGNGEVSFEIGPYDRTTPLVIDPILTLTYSTCLGGSLIDTGFAIVLDSSGSAYVTGQSYSTNFPTTRGAFQTSRRGAENVFVSKLNGNGSALIYSTYIGGSTLDGGNGIAVDSLGNAYVAGNTYSSDFPTTAGAFQTSLAGSENAFVSKLDPSGSALVYSTYVGGSGSDSATGISLDSGGHAYVVGQTSSPNFPTTAEAFQTSLAGTENAFITKLNQPGSALEYSTYLGGSGIDAGAGIAVDSAGNAYVTGQTASIDFPTTTGAFQTSMPIPWSAFVTKLNPSGSDLVYSTYLGGGGDTGQAIALDFSGHAYVAGGTSSSDFPFPTTPGAFQTSQAGFLNAFVTKLNPSGSAPMYSTLLGGSSQDYDFGIAVDFSGNVYLTGFAESVDFPTTPGAFQSALAGSQNAYVTVLNPGGSTLLYSTYLGGSSYDAGQGVAVDYLGNPYAVGYTQSSNFPTTPGAFQTALPAAEVTFVAKFENTPRAQVGNLQSAVKTLVSTGTLNAGLGQFLLVPLDAALAAAYAGRTGAAVPDLDALIFDIRLLVILRRLTPTEGQTLINAANSLIAELRG